MLKLISDKFEKEVDIKTVLSLISTCRFKDRDRLCHFEDELLRRNLCHWKLDESLILPTENIIEFYKNSSYHITEHDFSILTTLPYSTDNNFSTLKYIYNDLYNNEYYDRLSLDKRLANLPGGCLNPRYMFVGEAPGYHEDYSQFNGRVYTFGKTSMLFRILSSAIFKNCWYSNISKSAIFNNDKLDNERLKIALEYLKRELIALNSTYIISLGNYVYNVLKECCPEFKIYKIFHPAYIYRNGNNVDMYYRNMREILQQIEKDNNG